MRLDVSFASSLENLRFDDFLLGLDYPLPIIRVWESDRVFVVMGRGSDEGEVLWENCICDGVPVLRRSSGGGIVLQGKGCLNYTVCLPIDFVPECKSISGAFLFVLSAVKSALESLLSNKVNIDIKGTSDICIGDKKFSGNAQRRARGKFYVHGTVLYDMDLSLISRYIALPEVQPKYRMNREHSEFLCQYPIKSSLKIKNALLNMSFC